MVSIPTLHNRSWIAGEAQVTAYSKASIIVGSTTRFMAHVSNMNTPIGVKRDRYRCPLITIVDRDLIQPMKKEKL